MGTKWIEESRLGVALLMAVLALVGCSSATHGDPQGVEVMPTLTPASLGEGGKLRVVATTSIVADVVRNVGGDLIELSRLMPLGADPHAFQPTPQDAVAVREAHVVFINGAGLEIFIEDLLESAGAETPIVPVSHGIELLEPLGEAHPDDEHDDDEHDHGEVDPHTWFDPHNVQVWVDNIEAVLSTLDPANRAAYEHNAEAYRSELTALDAWIQDQIATVPEARRYLVTDHVVLTYFVARYDLEQLGVITAGASTLAEPSAQELAGLVEAIREYDVPAVFVSTTVNPRLADQIARDTGTEVVTLYTGSLSDEGGPASTYLDFMRYNVAQITEALRAGEE
ncbi:MAG: metal ABC transporter substrate-binding protein [Anaerolineae bacterium]